MTETTTSERPATVADLPGLVSYVEEATTFAEEVERTRCAVEALFRQWDDYAGEGKDRPEPELLYGIFDAIEVGLQALELRAGLRKARDCDEAP